MLKTKSSSSTNCCAKKLTETIFPSQTRQLFNKPKKN